jgi:hypothetical protein
MQVVSDIPSYVSWLLPVVVVGIVITFFWQSLITYLLYHLSKQDRGGEALQKHLQEVMAKAVDDRHSLTTKLVDERFRAMTHELNGHVQGFMLALDSIKSRLQDGDEHFEGLDERNQRIELAAAERVSQLKDYIRENMASKTDLERHQESMERKLNGVDNHLSQMGQDVAVLKAQGVKRGGQ